MLTKSSTMIICVNAPRKTHRGAAFCRIEFMQQKCATPRFHRDSASLHKGRSSVLLLLVTSFDFVLDRIYY